MMNLIISGVMLFLAGFAVWKAVKRQSVKKVEKQVKKKEEDESKKIKSKAENLKVKVREVKNKKV